MVKLNSLIFKNLFGLVLLSLFMFGLTACGVKVEKIELNETELLLDLNEESTAIATLTPLDIDVKVDWKSDNPAIATVTENGLIKGIAVGETTITASAGGVTATISVTVADLKYNVIFNTDEGTLVPIQTIRRGQKVTQPEDPTKVGFEFSGWYTASNLAVEFDFNTPITANTTIYAGWEDIMVAVNFDTTGGEVLEPINKVYGSALSETDLAVMPIKVGHTFVGWFLDTELSVSVEAGLIITESISIYASWAVNDYTVNFELDNDETIDPVELSYGSLIVVDTPSKEGYEFGGWFTDEERLNAFDILEDTVYGDMTLYAKWNIGKSTVSFNSNGGSSVPDRLVETYQPTSKPANPTKVNMLFVGWYEDASLTKAFDFNTPIVGNITLYALWEIDPSLAKTVEFELNGGRFPLTSTNFFIKYGVKPLLTFTGFIFDGNPWNNDTNGIYLHVQKNVSTGNYWPKAGLKRNTLGQYEVVDFVASGAIKSANYDYVISAWDQSGDIYQFVMSLQIGQIITITGADLTNDTVEGTTFERAIVNVYNASSVFGEINKNLLLSVPSLPLPVKDGFTFAGWYDNAEFTGDALTRLSASAKLYAKWE